MTPSTVHRQHDPAEVAPSASRYSQAVETAPGLRWLHVSGQVGIGPDGAIAPTAEAQHAQAWANALGLLEAAGMGVEHIVRVNGYLVGEGEVARFRAERDRVLGDARPASTVVLAAGLVIPGLVVEIELVAAAP